VSGFQRKQEGQDLVEASGPGILVVDPAFYFQEGKVDVGFPTFFDEESGEEFGVSNVALTFSGAYIQPDFEWWFGFCIGYKGQNAAVIPPNGGREDGEAGEDVEVLEPEEEGDEPAEGGAAESGVFGLREGTVGGVYEGFELLDEDAPVAAAFASAHAEVAGGGVFGHTAEAGVGDADEDDGFNLAGESKIVRGGPRSPGASWDVGGVRVEEVLAVVEVEDREAAVAIVFVLWREVDADGAVVGQDGGVEVEGLKAGDLSARIAVVLDPGEAGASLRGRIDEESGGAGGVGRVVNLQCLVKLQWAHLLR